MNSSLVHRLARASVLACLLCLPSCGYTYHFKNTNLVKGEEHNEWASYFIFGLVGDYEVNVSEFCPNGVAEIATGNNFLTWFLRIVTVGVYSPRKVNIWCAAGERTTSFDIHFGEDGKPIQVSETVGSLTWSGVAKPAGDGRFAVKLEEGAAQ